MGSRPPALAMSLIIPVFVRGSFVLHFDLWRLLRGCLDFGLWRRGCRGLFIFTFKQLVLCCLDEFAKQYYIFLPIIFR